MALARCAHGVSSKGDAIESIKALLGCERVIGFGNSGLSVFVAADAG
jgi:hypothetical protein